MDRESGPVVCSFYAVSVVFFLSTTCVFLSTSCVCQMPGCRRPAVYRDLVFTQYPKINTISPFADLSDELPVQDADINAQLIVKSFHPFALSPGSA